MATISLCMIVKNEETVLARCLDSIKEAVDEIIIVDTGSTDRTKEIALRYTQKLYNFTWIQDFAAARNEAFSKATMDYQMWLDADDVFPKAFLTKLLELKSSLKPDVDMVTMKYISHFDDQDRPVFTSTRERLFKRENNYSWQDPVHEFIPLAGKIVHSEIEVHHRKLKTESISTRNLDIYENLAKTEFTPRQLYYYARELKDQGMWLKSAYYFEKFLNTKKGWVEDSIAACYNLYICYNHLGDKDKTLDILLKSFEYDAPRAEICSEIGYLYKNMNQFATALKWFQVAANLDPPSTLGFILHDYWGYIPNIESCVCCCHLKDYESAKVFNERAASYKPDSPAVETNRQYLSQF